MVAASSGRTPAASRARASTGARARPAASMSANRCTRVLRYMNSARVSTTITPRTPGASSSTASVLSRCSWSSTITTRALDQQAGDGGRAEAAEVHRGLAILRRGTPPAEGRIVGTLMATDGVVQAVKRVGLDAGARVVGVAAAEAFRAGVPEGFRPEDILPGARSVVVAGGDGPTAGAWRCPDHRVMEITGYDLRENVAIHAMCDYIERELGYYAVQAPSLPVHGHEPPMSMMHAAELAGLGTRSFAAHIILNPEYGLLYYAALITTLPLPADPPLAEPACPHPGCVAMYKRICPVGRKHRKLK